MIKAVSLSQVYPSGTRGLKNLNLNIGSGEFVAVVGRSGSGKSTLFKTLNGMVSISSGSLEVLNFQLSKIRTDDLKKLRRQIGFIFQQFNLVKNLNVSENVLMGRLGYHTDISGFLGLYTPEDKKQALHYIKEVGLEGRELSRVDQISGGQQQRVAIARALVQDPKIILADEPMASLDPKLSEVVLDLLKYFNEKKKITVVVNIHVLELAKKYAQRIIGLREGELVYDGKPENLDHTMWSQIYE